ncbi:MAG: glycoside hydrolase family 3 C-terminal domain-containing protein [Acidobacteria bacterium]|nr:glycoside hydrolase family 3 C-terminal domain-containing protein [Acidobacteriota bacterium]
MLFKKALSLFLLLALGAPVAAVRAQNGAPSGRFEPSADSWKKADKLLKKMTIEEKVGQLIHIGVNAKFANQDSPYFKELQRQVVENKIGGIIFFGAPIYETTILENRMQQNAKIPLLMSLDAETGIGMRFEDAVNFPWAMAVAATGDPQLAYRVGVITGREAKAIGIKHVYAPVLDVNNNADNPVINVRSFGEDPQAVAKFGTSFIAGIQSQRVIATAKHFPGHGDTNIDSHRGLPIIDHSRESLEKTELVPFRAAVNSGVGSIMIAHIALPQIDPEEIRPLKDYQGGDAAPGAEIVKEKATIPATLSEKVQTELLRKDLGFKGLIVTDAMSMSGLTLYFNQAEAGIRAFLAGADILEKPTDPADPIIHGLIDAVKSGRITQARLDESVRKILAWKYELGLFKDKITPIDEIDRIVGGNESQALTDEIATRAITLVRDEQHLIPLDRARKIGVLGISNGIDGTLTMASTVAGLKASGVKFNSAYLQEGSSAEQVAAARKTLADCDTIIVGLFGRVRSGDKNSTGLPAGGTTLLRELLKSDKKVIGISYGNPYILQSFKDLKTYVVAYGDMPSLQRAAVRAILGEQDITGKLPISLPGLYSIGTGIIIKK